MRLGIVELYYGKSGKKGYYNNQEIGLAKALKKRGYDVFIFYPTSKGHLISEEVIEDRITIVNVPALIFGCHSIYNMSVLTKYGIDIVQIDTDNQLFACDVACFCNSHNIVFYNYIGTIMSDGENRIKKAILDFLYTRTLTMLKSSRCFVKTAYIRRILIEKGVKDVEIAHVGLDKSIIPLIGEDIDSLRKKEGIPLDVKVLLFVGRMDEYKHPLRAIDLIKHLPEDYYLVMIGNGSLDNRISRAIQDSGISNRVKRISILPNSEIHKYYRLSDYFLNFNEKEIFGMSLLEAMYQGCTPIAFQAPGPCEIIQNKETGFLVCSIEEMESVIVTGKKIDKNFLTKYICDSFTWDATAQILDKWIFENMRKSI